MAAMAVQEALLLRAAVVAQADLLETAVLGRALVSQLETPGSAAAVVGALGIQVNLMAVAVMGCIRASVVLVEVHLQMQRKRAKGVVAANLKSHPKVRVRAGFMAAALVAMIHQTVLVNWVLKAQFASSGPAMFAPSHIWQESN
jgi:hypothetical protein